jgi:DNA polymerase elongation subunit (family B)
VSLVLDIETGGRPDAETFCPEFAAPSNYKDAAKIAAVQAEKKAEWLDRAALSAISGYVIAVGLARDDKEITTLEGDEKGILSLTFDAIKVALENGGIVTGWNLLGFDLPFLAQRARVHGVTISPLVMSFYRGRPSWNQNIIDAQLVWLAGQREFTGHNLNTVCRLLGLGEKTGKGKDFAALWESDRDAAREYLKQDVKLTRSLAQRLGII